MGSIRMSNKVARKKGSAELNYHMRDEPKEVRGSIVGEGHRLSEEDESRVNEAGGDVNDGCEGIIVLASESGLQKQQQQPHGPFVQWERFLPHRSLKVLLVENDDSTRHVVSALLRNCSYEVTVAGNGLQAWKLLEDLTNHIDLVLTEVVMPYLSGIGLLSKIMSHKTCRNIPVIMMSSHDSMGIVLKCLSKGAVDFLVKPIRKNELKNLWHHVWRRFHSSSGSGSESGIQTQKSIKSKSVDESDNNTGSNDENDNESIGLNAGDGSDNGSGTQSSWTKRAIEADRPQPISPSDLVADPQDSTCALVIHLKPETCCNEWVPKTATRESQEQKKLLENVEMGKDLEIGVPTSPDLNLESYPRNKVSINLTGTKQNHCSGPERDNKESNEAALELNSYSAFGEEGIQAIDLISAIANSVAIAQMRTGVAEAPRELSKISGFKDKAIDDSQELPSLFLCLKRLRSAGDGGSAIHEERNVLRRSDLSAFSRYNNVAATTQTPTGFGGNYSVPLDNSLEAVKMNSVYNFPSNSNATPLNQHSNSNSNNNDMGSSTKIGFTKPAALKDESPSTLIANCLHPSSAFQPVKQSRGGPPQQVIPEKDDVALNIEAGQPSGGPVQVQHHHYHYHHHRRYHVHSMEHQQKLPPPDQDDLSLKSMAPQCGSSTLFSGPVEGNAGNYSRNESVSGSNHGSNGQNGSSMAVNGGGMNMESENGAVGKSGTGVGSGSGSGSGSAVNQNRFAQREAALNKFRLKRKERCFKKKVRYQNSKRLAEQRPRPQVRGQFVRQIVYEHS
ncbi:two-component response regulator-like PRR37 [Tasmannia lanceolata]|uniref:two-component response regulator-like PRR37 n=1 Tax=Tasmannia lanceolata TaxID=3420 RepID=UPI0040629245